MAPTQNGMPQNGMPQNGNGNKMVCHKMVIWEKSDKMVIEKLYAVK